MAGAAPPAGERAATGRRKATGEGTSILARDLAPHGLAGTDGGTPGAQDRRSGIGLDWLNFFTANLQTAFGPFVSVYLTQLAWTQGDIGLALSVGYVASMAGQVPAGALVDAMARKSVAVALAILAIVAGALTLAFLPTLLPVLAAEVSHAFASCMLGPAIAAISLALAGGAAGRAGERLGRNARFASIGNGTAAGLMALVGKLLGARAVFIVGALLALPGLVALRMITDRPVQAAATRGRAPLQGLAALLTDWRLLGFAACCMAFHLSNADMLPLAASAATASLGNNAALVIGACIVGPQIVVALLSPSMGLWAERWGRRPVLAVGMIALPLRGLALALIAGETAIPGWQLIVVQLLDGVSGAAFGVLMPLIAADIAQAAGRFNLCMGVLGLAIGAAAAASTYVGGYLADTSLRVAFLSLAGAGAVGVVLALAMPETGPVGKKNALLF